MDKRIRRSKQLTHTPIEIEGNEFELLISYINIITNKLSFFIKRKLSFRINSIEFSTLKSKNVDKKVLDGEIKLSNTISIKLSDINDIDVKELFISFAKENRYLNIETNNKNNSIKVENSDKYQYFNIEATFDNEFKGEVILHIYSRRFFKVKSLQKGLFKFL